MNLLFGMEGCLSLVLVVLFRVVYTRVRQSGFLYWWIGAWIAYAVQAWSEWALSSSSAPLVAELLTLLSLQAAYVHIALLGMGGWSLGRRQVSASPLWFRV